MTVPIPEIVHHGITGNDIRYFRTWHLQEAESMMAASAEDAPYFKSLSDPQEFSITIRIGTETTGAIFRRTVVRFQEHVVILSPEVAWLCRVEFDEATDQFTMKIIRKEKRPNRVPVTG